MSYNVRVLSVGKLFFCIAMILSLLVSACAFPFFGPGPGAGPAKTDQAPDKHPATQPAPKPPKKVGFQMEMDHMIVAPALECIRETVQPPMNHTV